MAAGVVHALAHLDGVGPDELLGVVEPPRLELLLANRADAVREDRVVGDGDVLELRRLLQRCCCSSHARGRLAVSSVPHVVFVDGFPALDPVLVVVKLACDLPYYD